MKENELTIARLAMAGLIVIAILFGSYRSMSRLVHSVSVIFYQGVAGDGLGIDNDLNERISLSFNLSTIAQSYVSDGSIEPVLKARQSLIDAKSIPEKYQANVQLTEATTKLIELLGEYKLSDKHEDYRNRLKADLLSRNATISHDGYNDIASKANETLNGIPAKWLRGLLGVNEVPLFR